MYVPSFRLENISGDITAKTSDGDLSIKKAKGSVRITTSDGDIEVSDIIGKVNVLHKRREHYYIQGRGQHFHKDVRWSYHFQRPGGIIYRHYL